MLTATRGPYVLVIQPDDDPFNPREDDNFGKMVCFHRRAITWATITIT